MKTSSCRCSTVALRDGREPQQWEDGSVCLSLKLRSTEMSFVFRCRSRRRSSWSSCTRSRCWMCRGWTRVCTITVSRWARCSGFVSSYSLSGPICSTAEPRWPRTFVAGEGHRNTLESVLTSVSQSRVGKHALYINLYTVLMTLFTFMSIKTQTIATMRRISVSNVLGLNNKGTHSLVSYK